MMNTVSLLNEDDAATITLDGQVIQIEQANISGIILWKDSENKENPVRRATVELRQEGKVFSTDQTDILGAYTLEFNGIDQNKPISVRVLADGLGHLTQNSKTGTYYIDFDPFKNKKFVIGNKTDTELAFSGSDALFVGEIYAATVRGELPKGENGQILKVKLEAPVNVISPGFNRSTTNPTILIDALSGKTDFDEILHEYGHFIAKIDNLDSSPAEDHIPGFSNIVRYGKNQGIKLGWGEGLATYLSFAAQEVFNKSPLATLPKVPGLGDLEYAGSPINIESTTSFTPPEPGEGEEVTVSRILWDLADGINESHDRIAIGHKDLYGILKEIPALDSLYDVWKYFYDNPNKLVLVNNTLKPDAKRAELGAIFEEYGVSPHLTEVTLGNQTIYPDKNHQLLNFKPDNSGALPIFTFERGNNNANDQFQVFIFNSDFSKDVLISPPSDLAPIRRNP